MESDGDLENKVRDAGYDLAFVRNLARLEEARQLVDKGELKYEVYKALEQSTFGTQRKEEAQSTEKKKTKKLFGMFGKPKRNTAKSVNDNGGGVRKNTFTRVRNFTSRSFSSRVSNASTKLKEASRGSRQRNTQKTKVVDWDDSYQSLKEKEEEKLEQERKAKEEAERKAKEEEKYKKIEEENLELRNEVNVKEEQLKKFAEEKEIEIKQIKEEKEDELREERKKNDEWNQKYDELMAKYRAEALERNNKKREEEEKLKKKIAHAKRKSVLPATADAQYFKDELKKLKAQLETLQKALNVDLDEMNWDGTLEQAEERMQECLKNILEGETEAIQQKAQSDFDKWDQIVRSHKDFITREENKWKDWEEKEGPKNLAAKEEMREKYVPEKYLKGCSIEELISLKGMKKKEAERIFKNKIFKFLWMPPENIAKLHAAALLNDYASQGLDIRELRAVYASLPLEFMNDNDGKKRQFRENLRARLFDLSAKEEKGTLSASETLHNAYRDKAVKAHVARPAVKREKRKKNAAMQNKAAALEAFFNKQGGGAAPPKKKKAAPAEKKGDELDVNDPKWKKFFNMQKMNLPDGAIEAKMVQEQIDPKMWAKLKEAKTGGGGSGSSNNTKKDEFDANDPKWKKFFQMQKMNLPDGAIEAKMVQEQIDPKMWAKLKEAKAGGGKKQEKKDDFDPSAPEWQKYVKMQKAGLPDGAVEGKMQQDGKDPSLWQKIKAASSSSSEDNVKKAPPKVKEEPLDPDAPKFRKYFKMKKMGLGDGAIESKMIQDEMDPKIWSQICKMKEAKNPAQPKAARDSLANFIIQEKKPDWGVKSSNTLVSEGTDTPEVPKEKEMTVTETMQEMMKNEMSKKKKKKSKKKRKKSSKRISVADLNDRKEKSKRRGTRRALKNTLKQDNDVANLLNKMNLDDLQINHGKRNGSRAIGLLDVESKYGRSERRESKKESLMKKPGRRKTLRNSKVGVTALQNDSSLQEVIDCILSEGEFDEAEGGVSSMKFGEIFDRFEEIDDILMGLLLKGKKTKILKYRGDMLFKGIHDEVKITVLSPT